MATMSTPPAEPINARLRKILDLLDRRPGVDTLWVYGSEATGRAGAGSDLDLAALFRDRPSAVELVELRSEAEALVGRPVDLVDLDDASPLLAHQVLKHGRLLVDRDPPRRHRFAAAVPARREDLLILRRPIEKALFERMRGRIDGGP